jgi:hypothetical protein
MKKSAYILIPLCLLLTLFSSCKSKKHVMEKPDNLINRITLVNILAESYIIESTLQFTPTDSIPKQELARRYYKDLFDRYHITNKQFESSIAYYVSEEKSAEKLLNDASALIISKKGELFVNDTVPTNLPF